MAERYESNDVEWLCGSGGRMHSPLQVANTLGEATLCRHKSDIHPSFTIHITFYTYAMIR